MPGGNSRIRNLRRKCRIWLFRLLALTMVVIITVMWVLLLEGYLGKDTMDISGQTVLQMGFLKSAWSFLRRILYLVLLVYVLWCLLLYLYQDRMMFPYEVVPKEELSFSRKSLYTEVWIETAEGHRVEGHYYTSRLAADGQARPAVIFFHGNAESIGLVDEIAPYYQWGFNILLPEYRGYGRSGGLPGQKAIMADMYKFHAWLVQRPEVDSKRLIYHGRSLGGAVACQLAGACAPAALILQSTFTSTGAMASRFCVPPFLLKHPFRSDKVVAKLACPIFITHGIHDSIIPVQHARTLHRLAPHSEYYEVPSDHNDFPMDKNFWQNIAGFLRKAGILDNPALERK